MLLDADLLADDLHARAQRAGAVGRWDPNAILAARAEAEHLVFLLDWRAGVGACMGAALADRWRRHRRCDELACHVEGEGCGHAGFGVARSSRHLKAAKAKKDEAAKPA